MNEEFKLLDGLYLLRDVYSYFQYIKEKYK